MSRETCVHCGRPLPPGRATYCQWQCRLEYDYPLTDTQRKILVYICTEYLSGYLPRQSDIQEHMGWSNSAVVSRYFDRLERKDWLIRQGYHYRLTDRTMRLAARLRQESLSIANSRPAA